MDESITLCKGCGAVRDGVVETCRFCGHKHEPGLELVATMCWACQTWNDIDFQVQSCTKCGVALWAACTSCQQYTPHHLRECVHCGKLP
ncbi:MAG: hypothetical protein U0271_13815 [Polyangiaceae bacterium]